MIKFIVIKFMLYKYGKNMTEVMLCLSISYQGVQDVNILLLEMLISVT